MLFHTSLGPRPKTNPSMDRFQYRVILEAIASYTCRMRSGDETSSTHGTDILHLLYVLTKKADMKKIV